MSGELDLSSTEPPPSIECDLPLGRPGFVVHNELVLSGWAASPKGISGVAVQIDDRVWNAGYGLDTPQLAERLHGFPAADRAGYRLVIDTSAWTPGPHYVTVAAFDLEGGRSAVEGSVEVAPFEARSSTPADLDALGRDEVALAIDLPRAVGGRCEVAGPLEIIGWTYAREGIEAVLVTLDGTLQYEALMPVVRPDLLDRLGHEVAANAGFALRIHPTDCPPGHHRLSVTAVSHSGRTAGVEYDIDCRRETDVEWAPELAEPSLRDGEPTADDARMWESRALLAEADAALSRAEADLARAAQEATLRKLRATEARLPRADFDYRSWDRPQRAVDSR